MQPQVSRPTKERRRALHVFLWIEFWLIALLALTDCVGGIFEVSDRQMLVAWCWLFVLVTIWVFGSWRHWMGALLMPFPIFLMAAVAFNGGQILLQALGLNHGGLIPMAGVSEEILLSTVRYVTWSIVVFHFGGMLGAWRRRLHGDRVDRMGPQNQLLRAMRSVGVVLLIIGIPFWTVIEIRALIVSLSQGYSSLYQQAVPIGVFAAGNILSKLVIPGVMLSVVGYRHDVVAVRTLSVLVGLMALGDLLLGYRAFAIWPVLGFAWVVHTQVRRIPTLPAVGGAGFLLVVVFPLVRTVRNLSGAERSDPRMLLHAYTTIENPVIGIVQEMGGSMATVSYTLQYIPEEKHFDYGAEYLYGMLSVLPNMFGAGVHPTIAHGVPSHWLIAKVDPWTAERGGGLGYSFIAEAYYNFGDWAGLLTLMVVGFAMSWMFARLIQTMPPLGIAIAGTILAFCSHYARGELYTVVRPVVWFGLVPMLAVVTVLRSIKRREGVATLLRERQLEVSGSR